MGTVQRHLDVMIQPQGAVVVAMRIAMSKLGKRGDQRQGVQVVMGTGQLHAALSQLKGAVVVALGTAGTQPGLIRGAECQELSVILGNVQHHLAVMSQPAGAVVVALGITGSAEHTQGLLRGNRQKHLGVNLLGGELLRHRSGLLQGVIEAGLLGNRETPARNTGPENLSNRFDTAHMPKGDLGAPKNRVSQPHFDVTT